jgi:hypothetical protein
MIWHISNWNLSTHATSTNCSWEHVQLDSITNFITSYEIKITFSSFLCNFYSAIQIWSISRIKKVPSIFWCQGLDNDQMLDAYEMFDFSLWIPKKTSSAPPNLDKLIS